MAANRSAARRRVLRLAAGAGAAAAAPPGLIAQPVRAPLQIVGPWEITGLQPTRGYIFTRMQVTETLVDAADDGTLVPALARRWEVSADRLEWRFDLRATARFHDGTPLRAAHVARCLEAARTPPALLSQAPLAAIETEGELRVVLRLRQPYAMLPALLAHHSTMILAPASFARGDRVRAIIGSGPYRIVELAHPQKIATAFFEQFDGPRPVIEAARYLAASRFETRALMAEAGQADLAYQLDPSSLRRLRGRARLSIERVTLPRTLIVKLNAGRVGLRDIRVRRALSLAIDRAGIARALLRDPEMAAGQLFPPTLPGWHDPALPALDHDRAQALRLLDEAGWPRGADGIRVSNGQRLQLTLRTFSDRPELPLLATALQEQWRQVGVAVEISVGNSGDIPLGHRDGTLDLGLLARNYAQVPDPSGALLQDFGERGGDWGAMGWRDASLVAALDELARGTPDAGRAQALRRRVAGALHDGLPVIPVAWYRQQVVVAPRVAGVTLDPLERSYRIAAMRWRT